jgi:hypothetical protein
MDTKGKTIWEMLVERVKTGNGSGVPFYNPLDLRINSAVEVPFSNGLAFQDHDFSVQEIREYTRRIGAQEFRFTDYVLKGVNTKSFDADKALLARLRVVPNSAGSHTSLLLRVYDEFEFAEDFLGVLKDDTGLFEMTDDEAGTRDTFTRINGLKTSYEAAVLVVPATTPEGKAVSASSSPVKVEYWDYWRDAELGGGKTAKEFVFVEMNSETGWFQIWRGGEFFG